MNRYIVTCSIANREQTAMVFDSQRVAVKTVKKIIKSTGAKVKFKDRHTIDWTISRSGVSVSFRHFIADEQEISYTVISSAEPTPRQFARRTDAIKYVKKSTRKLIRIKESDAGEWYFDKGGQETSIRVLLTVGSAGSLADYKLLGLDKDATVTEIKKAYRDKVKTAHPDHGGTEQQMKDLTEAYKRIVDVDVSDDQDKQQFQSVTPQFLYRELLYAFVTSSLTSELSNEKNRENMRKVIMGIVMIVFAILVAGTVSEGADQQVAYIVAAGLFIYGVSSLIEGSVGSIQR